MKKNSLVILLTLCTVITAGCGNIKTNSSQPDSAAVNVTEAVETTAAETVTEAQKTTAATEAVTEETTEKNDDEDIKKEAALKIKGFNRIHATLTGVGADEAGILTETDVDCSTLTDTDGNPLKSGCYKLLNDDLKSKDDMKKLIDDTFSDFDYSNFDEFFAQTDDALYVYSDILIQHNGKAAYYFFNTDESQWEYSDITDDSFSVTSANCKGRHDFKFTVKLDFTKTDNGWKIKDFNEIDVVS